MAQRKKIALIFSYSENWIGGTYYILNLIHALKHLSEKDRPEICLCTEAQKDFDYVKQQTNYPHLKYFPVIGKQEPYKAWQRAINFIGRIFSNKTLIQRKEIPALPNSFDLVFPNPHGQAFRLIDEKHKLFWIPDFQEAHLENFFSAEEIYERKRGQLHISLLTQNVVFSSKDALKDFETFYPFARCKSHLLHFAVTHPNYSGLDIKELKTKYNISKPYFMSPNQFWVHKNHKVVLEAIQELKKSGIEATVLFSGKEHDYRQPNYTDEIKHFVKENSLSENIKFLGFIDRAEQLQLMNHAVAILQPSYFEGWSTVVEDAKAMDQNIIASDLAVHREQLKEKGFFFNPDKAIELAQILHDFLDSPQPRPAFEYSGRVNSFADQFLTILR